jgi:Holliday junction resolvase
MAKHSRLDETHRSVRNALTSLGCSVVSTTSMGSGFPDMVVGLMGETHLVEVKTRTGKLRESQVKFSVGWRGCPIWILRSAEDAMTMVASIRKEVAKRDSSLV